MRQALITTGLLLPLGLDTFALAAALGIAGLARKDRLRVALVFTTFEAAMPILGVLAGRAVGAVLGDWAGYGAIVILAIAGVAMIRPGRDEQGESRRLQLLASARGAAIVYLGLSISLDELTIGFSAGLLGLSLMVTVVWVAVQAFIAAQVGLGIGARLGEEIRERAEWLAGLALIVVALILLLLRLLGI